MKLVSGIVDSGFFAQSALSAEVATKDSLGRNISETYLTGVDQVISSYATATNVNSAIITNLNGLELSARKAWNAQTAYYDSNGINLANATNSAKSGYAASAWINAHSSDYQTITGMTAYQPVGSYLTADALDNVSGDWNEVSAKLDTTAFSDVSGSFLTAHQDISNKLDTTAFSDVSGSFLTAVPEGYATEQWVGEQGYLTAHQSLEGYLQDSDLGIVNDKITAISGVELSAGTELEFEYDAADNISAINNSAISTTPAQPLYAKSPLYFDVTGTSSYIGWRPDETEILDSTAASAFTLKEPLTAFNEIHVKIRWWDKVPDCYYNVERFSTAKMSLSWTYFDNISDPSPLELAGASWTSTNGTNYTLEAGFAKVFATGSTAISNFTHDAYPISILGIGRKEV